MSVETDRRTSLETPLLSQVEFVTEREGGIIEAHVPIALIDQEEVAVDQAHVEQLAESMRSQSEGNNTTGQLTPVLLGDVSGRDRFVILDGFHRVPAVALNGNNKVYCTIKTDCTPLDAIDIRIVAAKSHNRVKFSRIVEWVEDAWAETRWADIMDVSSAFTMSLLNSNGGRSGLGKDEIKEIKEWIAQRCKQWGVSHNYIDKYLRTAKSADPLLVKRARERKSGHTLEDITPEHLVRIGRLLAHQYDLQHVVADAAIQHTLTVAQTEALSLAISRAKSYESMNRYIDTKVWVRMGAASKAVTKKRYKDIDLDTPGDYIKTLIDKFFDDQVAIVELMIENAVLLGHFDPEAEASSPALSALLIEKELDDLEPVDVNEVSETAQWDTEKIKEIAVRAFELQAFLKSTVKRKFPSFNETDAEDIVSTATLNFLDSVNGGNFQINMKRKVTLDGYLR